MHEDDDTLEVPHRTPRGQYDGAELKPFSGRPGAMDCFQLPSRMGSRLYFRDGTVEEVEQ